MRRRRKYIVSFQHQVKYVFKILVPIILILGVYWLAVNAILNYQLKTSDYIFDFLSKKIPLKTPSLLNKMKDLNYLTLQQVKIYLTGGLLILLISIFFILSVFFHRTAGPISRLTKYLKMLSEGKQIPPVRVRKTDEFKEVAFYIEELRKYLEENATKREEIIKKIEQDLYKLKTSPSQELISEIESLIKELKKLI